MASDKAQEAKQWADALMELSEQRAKQILELEQQLAQALRLQGVLRAQQEVTRHELEQAEHLNATLLATVQTNLDVMQADEAWKAQARALLELFAANDAEPLCIHDDCIDCILCDTRIQGEVLQRYLDVKRVYPHAPECFWLKARAFLAEHEEPQP